MKIKKTGLLLGAFALMFSPNVSFAADLPVKTAAAPAYYDWSEFMSASTPAMAAG